jgi:hypothetical protein
MQHDLIAFGQSGNDFSLPIVAVPNLDWRGTCPSAPDSEDSPIVAVPK